MTIQLVVFKGSGVRVRVCCVWVGGAGLSDYFCRK
jgi:hypothetical protein